VALSEALGVRSTKRGDCRVWWKVDVTSYIVIQRALEGCPYGTCSLMTSIRTSGSRRNGGQSCDNGSSSLG